MPEITYDLEPYLAKIDFTETELDRLCVKKAEVIGVSSRQSVKIRCEGVEYDDVPVWIHTDCGARHWCMKGLEAEKNGQTPPIAPTAGEYFKDAALMFPFPDGAKIYLLPSGQQRVALKPEVLVLFEILPNNAIKAISVINILASVLLENDTDEGFPTYRPYVYMTIASEVNDPLGIPDGINNSDPDQRYREQVYLFDIMSGETAMVPTYEAGVPKLPLIRAEAIPYGDRSKITNFLEVGWKVNIETIPQPSEDWYIGTPVGDVYSPISGPNFSECYDGDGRVVNPGATYVEGVGYVSNCTGDVVLRVDDAIHTYYAMGHVARDGFGKIGNATGANVSPRDMPRTSTIDLYGGTLQLGNDFKIFVEQSKHLNKTGSVDDNAHTSEWHEEEDGGETITLSVYNGEENTWDIVDSIGFTFGRGPSDLAGSNVDDGNRWRQQSGYYAWASEGVKVSLSETLSHFKVDPGSNFFLGGMGVGVSAIAFEKQYSMTGSTFTTAYAYPYNSIFTEEIGDVSITATRCIFAFKDDPGRPWGINRNIFEYIRDQAVEMARQEDFSRYMQGARPDGKNLIYRSFKYSAIFGGIYFVPFDRRIELLKEQSE